MPKRISTYPNEILKTAIQVFSENGEQTTISQIAKESNLPQSSIFRYFPSRLALILKIHNCFWSIVMTELHSADKTSAWDEENPNAHVKIQRIVIYYQRFISLNSELTRAVMLTFLPDPEKIEEDLKEERLKIQEKKQQVLTFLDKLIEKGQGEGCFIKILNPKVIRKMILGYLYELACELLLKTNRKESDPKYLHEAKKGIDRIILSLAENNNG